MWRRILDVPRRHRRTSRRSPSASASPCGDTQMPDHNSTLTNPKIHLYQTFFWTGIKHIDAYHCPFVDRSYSTAEVISLANLSSQENKNLLHLGCIELSLSAIILEKNVQLSFMRRHFYVESFTIGHSYLILKGLRREFCYIFCYLGGELNRRIDE